MSVTTEKLAYLQGTKEEIRNAIIEKGVDVSTSDTFRSYAGSIRKISTGGVRSCRFVIGTSTAGWTEKDCDYLCDGVDDQVEINAAIQALPSTGGEIKVLDGTYNITASINIDKERVTFGGCGQSTIFKRMWKSSSNTEGVIQFSTSYCTFKDFEIDGNKSVYAGGSGLCLTEKNITSILIENTFINNNYNYGVYATYIENSVITDNIFNLNRMSISCEYAQHTILSNNFGDDSRYSDDISVYGSKYCTVIGNIFGSLNGSSCKYCTFSSNELCIDLSYANKCTITGNTCSGGASGMTVVGTKNCTITCNVITEFNGKGIDLADANYCIVLGNICIRGGGTSSDYTSSQNTIYTDSGTNNCVIVGNNCSGKAPTVAGTGNIVENNLS